MTFVNMLMLARDESQMIPTRENEIWGFMGAFLPLAFIAVSLRLYSRWKFAKIGADDLAVLVGMILYIGLIIATVFAVKFGLGRHIWDVLETTEISMQKCGFTSQVLYPPALCAVKLSIVLFLLRTLPPAHDWITPLRCFAAWVVVEESAFTIALFLQCRPINFYWDKAVDGTCFNQPIFYYVDAGLNMATDICILTLPYFIFRNLNISKRRKYELLGLCSVGVFTLISSIVRLPYLHDLNISKDPTWHVVDICIWSIAELGSAITLCSVPAIRPLVSYAFPRLGSGNRSEATPKMKRGSIKTGSGSGTSDFSNPSRGGNGDGPAWFPYTELDDIERESQKSVENRPLPQHPRAFSGGS